MDKKDKNPKELTGISSNVDLEKLFQEAEETINNIIKSKKELKKDKTKPMASAPELQAELEAEYTETIKELETLQNKYRELESEFQNYKTRTEKEAKLISERAKAKILKDLVNILDIFDFAESTFNSEKFNHTIESYQKGFNLLYRQLFELLMKIGMQKIKAEGQEFDPNLHQAVAIKESKQTSTRKVIKEIKPGYIYNGILLRPSMVIVSIPAMKKNN